jgi:energy-coupling factor transporter ATP-binding protein EcfA2
MGAMMKPFIAVVGNRDSGKSTIIRSLTGAKFGQFRGTVQDMTTSRTIEVIGSSPQERLLSLADLRKVLRKAAGAANCNGIVCALQPTRPTKRLSMEQVLQEAAAHGFAVHAYILDPEYGGAAGHAAVVAARIRVAGFGARALDGRRFAQINAAAINGHTRIAS